MMSKLRISTITSAVALSVAAVMTAEAAPHSYIVMTDEGAFTQSLDSKIAAAGGKLTSSMPALGMAVVQSDRAGFAAAVAKVSGVRSVLPNVVTNWLPTDTVNVEFSDEYGYPPSSLDNDSFFNLQWGHKAVDAVGAWNLGFRGAGSTVAVLDTGFDLDHPDLAPNIIAAVSVVDSEPSPSYALADSFSHGTHTAGTIAAADNGRGTIGVAPDAKLVLVKVLRDSGSGSFADIIEGLYYAANRGDVAVISMSLGAALPKNGFVDDNGTPDDPSDDVKVGANAVAGLLTAIGRATTYAYQRGITVIASAGNDANDGNKDKALVHTPSDAPNVISISATAPIGWATNPTSVYLDNLASYSNYGSSVIDFAAPGGDFVYPGNENCTVAGLVRPCWVFDMVFSTGSSLDPNVAAYYWSAGTSMAAPHAAGVAAIIVGKNGGAMNPAQVAAVLRRSADDLGKPGNDYAYGAGRVNAAKAVQ